MIHTRFGRSVAEQAQSTDIRVFPGLEELSQTALDRMELVLRFHLKIVLESLWDKKEKVGSFYADVALPEVEEVHVICGCFTPLNFEDDASIAEGEKIVWPQAADRPREKAFALALESKTLRRWAEG